MALVDLKRRFPSLGSRDDDDFLFDKERAPPPPKRRPNESVSCVIFGLFCLEALSHFIVFFVGSLYLVVALDPKGTLLLLLRLLNL